MAHALQCDRCKKLFTRKITPDLRIGKYYHGSDEYACYDLCDDCTNDLEKFMKNETVHRR